VIIATSAYLRLSQAGLDCADWPACYGHLRPSGEPLAAAKADGVSQPLSMTWPRIAHRFAASAVAVLNLILALLCWFRRPVSWQHRAIAMALLGLTLFLAVLGRWTPAARIPAVAIGNLLGGFTLLATLWWLRLLSAPATSGTSLVSRRLQYWAKFGLLALVIQIALGGLVSAHFAALSCANFPDCNGNWWPGGLSLTDLNPFKELALGSDGKVIIPAAMASVHMLHRLGALIVFGYLTLLAIKLLRLGNGYKTLGLILLVLSFVQVTLGISVVLFNLPLKLVVAHNGVAAVLLLTLVSVHGRLSLHSNHPVNAESRLENHDR
jgi:cytochrome c oxidase assembly protein subunit 15